MKRTELREHIFKVLFGVEFNAEQEMPEQLQLYFEQLEDAREKDLDYIRTKSSKIAEKIAEIDSLINEHTTGWKTSRMNKVDLTILRLALYEMLYEESVPEQVAINEAVEIARKYGGDDSPSFVNGILAKLIAEK